jgi:hypothetical protein
MFVVVVMAAVGMILMTMVLAWAVYSISTLKKQMVYIDELNSVVEQLNALTYAIHRAHMRSAKRIDSAKSEIGSVDKKRADLEGAMVTLRENVRSIGDSVRTNYDNSLVIQQNLETVAGDVSSNYVRTDAFNDVFENRYFSVTAGGAAFDPGSSEIKFGATDASKVILQSKGDELNMGTQSAHISVTNSGVKFCAQSAPGVVACNDVAMAPVSTAPAPA